MIFDNVEQWEDIQKYVPESTVSSGCILITTQRPGDQIGWSENNVKLAPFESSLASELLLSSMKLNADKEYLQDLAVEITDIIGGLPLYLNQARGFMNSTKSPSKNSLEEYLSLVQNTSTIPKNISVDRNLGYSEKPNAAFDLTLSRLTEHTRDLLNILAFLNPEAIPEDMIFVHSQSDDELQFLDPNDKYVMFGHDCSQHSS